jgi:hypothetical protein
VSRSGWLLGAFVVALLFWVLMGGFLYVRVYLPAAAQKAKEVPPTAQEIACNAMYRAADAGRVVLTPRDKAYCAPLGGGL